MKLLIGHLYADYLNIYGDRGNIICLKKRCLWREIKAEVKNISIGDKLKPGEFDLFFGGGGQDRQQLIVSQDLQAKKQVLKHEADRGVPMLLICGTYQLFGHYFQTFDHKKIPGISVFNLKTVAGQSRKIGNIVVGLNQKVFKKYSFKRPQLVGFENHSGSSYISLGNKTQALGQVINGFGNNGRDKTEGAVYKNVFGCYLHGPLLPKNPHFADLLIKLALENKYKKPIDLKLLDDRLEWQAFKSSLKRS
jgi:lipid II isoglutaminyl synthase (glutamine-hydrolysing)